MNANQVGNLVTTIIQSLLGGFVAKGTLDHSQAETLAGAAGIIFVWLVSHVWHSEGSPPSGTTKISALLVFGALAGTVVFSTGCKSFSANSFSAEYAAAATCDAAMKSYAVYWDKAFVAPEKFHRTADGLQAERATVEAAAVKVGASLELAENLRGSYATNSTILPQLQAAESALAANVTGIIALVSQFETVTNH